MSLFSIERCNMKSLDSGATREGLKYKNTVIKYPLSLTGGTTAQLSPKQLRSFFEYGQDVFKPHPKFMKLWNELEARLEYNDSNGNLSEVMLYIWATRSGNFIFRMVLR